MTEKRLQEWGPPLEKALGRGKGGERGLRRKEYHCSTIHLADQLRHQLSLTVLPMAVLETANARGERPKPAAGTPCKHFG